MNPLPLCNSFNTITLHLRSNAPTSQSSPFLIPHVNHSHSLNSISWFPSLNISHNNTALFLAIFSKSKISPPYSQTVLSPLGRWHTTRCDISSDHTSSAAGYEIDMVQNKQGVYAPKPKKVVVLWDLDNKPPRGPPYQAAIALKQVAQRFGDIVDMSAYANRHAFVHLPNWVLEQRRERKQLDILERKRVVVPADPYVCGVCGRKCKTNFDLKKHFKQLHERERQKKLSRMRSLKGKKRQKYKERFVSGNHKYNETARTLINPKVGYGLASELRRAGVFVKTVEDKPQAADWALKRQMQHSMSRGIDWLFLVSDDSDFSEMLRRARDADLGTVVVGDADRALGRYADLWIPWNGVENGELSEKDLIPESGRRNPSFVCEDGLFSVSEQDGDVDGVDDLDTLMDELAARRTRFNDLASSGSSDEEGEGGFRVTVETDGDFLLEWSEDEDAGDDWFYR